MQFSHRVFAVVTLALTLFLAAPSAQQAAAPKVTSPKTFFGHDIGVRSVWWAAAVGIVLYLEIAHEQRQVEHLLGKQDAIYRYVFPIFSFALLALLPMVKSLFVLTSMTFSFAVPTSSSVTPSVRIFVTSCKIV